MDVVRRSSEVLRVGEITHRSPGLPRKDGWRDKDPALGPKRDWEPDRPGMLSMGGRNAVECKPDIVELECVLVLATTRH